MALRSFCYKNPIKQASLSSRKKMDKLEESVWYVPSTKATNCIQENGSIADCEDFCEHMSGVFLSVENDATTRTSYAARFNLLIVLAWPLS